MFFTRLNLVQTISRSAIQIATTMSSVESPYFNVECQTATDEMLMLPSTGTRQTRSTAKSKALKIKVETDVSELLNVKAKKSRKNAVKKEENSEWVPEHWEAVLDNIRTMRAARDAPVDQMGAEKCTDTDISPEVKIIPIHIIYIFYGRNVMFAGETIPSSRISHALKSDQGSSYFCCHGEAQGPRPNNR